MIPDREKPPSHSLPADIDVDDYLRLKIMKLICEMDNGDLRTVAGYVEGIYAAKYGEKKSREVS